MVSCGWKHLLKNLLIREEFNGLNLDGRRRTVLRLTIER